MTGRAKLSVLLFSAALTALPLQAQQRSSIGVVAGIASGRMLEEFEGDPRSDDDDSLLGFVLGLSMHRAMNGPLSFAPEALYVTKGYSDGDSDGRISMSYIEVPLLLRYGFETSGNIKPFLTTGPQFGLQLSCNLHDSDGDTESCDDFFTEDESYKTFDAGLVIGGGLTRDKWSLHVRYDLSLLNIAKSEGWVSKHRALMILLGFQL